MSARRELADEIDRLDAEIKVLQDDKREYFKSFREAYGKAECRAAQAAIKKRQRSRSDKADEIEEHDALVEVIFEEISAPAPRATRSASGMPDAA